MLGVSVQPEHRDDCTVTVVELPNREIAFHVVPDVVLYLEPRHPLWTRYIPESIRNISSIMYVSYGDLESLTSTPRPIPRVATSRTVAKFLEQGYVGLPAFITEKDNEYDSMVASFIRSHRSIHDRVATTVLCILPIVLNELVLLVVNVLMKVQLRRSADQLLYWPCSRRIVPRVW
jgi:hypothetical protein